MKFQKKILTVITYLIGVSPLFLYLMYVPPVSELEGASAMGALYIFIPIFISFIALIPLALLLHGILLICEKTTLVNRILRAGYMLLLLVPYYIYYSPPNWILQLGEMYVNVSNKGYLIGTGILSGFGVLIIALYLWLEKSVKKQMRQE